MWPKYPRRRRTGVPGAPVCCLCRKDQKMTSVASIFDSMAYGPAPEGHAEALAWIAGHQGRFGHWINGAFTAPGAVFETRNPATGKVLAEVSQGAGGDISAAVAAARAARWLATAATCSASRRCRLAHRPQRRSASRRRRADARRARGGCDPRRAACGWRRAGRGYIPRPRRSHNRPPAGPAQWRRRRQNTPCSRAAPRRSDRKSVV